jgi:MFS family permease
MKSSPFKMLCGTGLFAIFSSTISKSPVLPLFATHLGAGPSEVGLIAAVSALMGVVFSIPAGMLSDKLGRKNMLLFSAVIFASAPFLYLLVNNLWQLALVRFYHGMATAAFIPVAMALVSDLFHKERGEKMGWFSTSTLIGRFVAPIVGGAIIGSIVFNPGLSFKAVYLACGVSGVIALLLILRIPDPQEETRRHRSWKETMMIFRTVATKKPILIASAVEASVLFAYGTFETFLPLYALQKKLTAYEVGIFLSSQVLTLALMKPVMGKFSDRHGRKPQIFAGALMGGVCIGSFSSFSSFLPLFSLSILFGLSISVVTSATAALIADLSERTTHGSAMGMLGSVMDIGHTTGPLIAGMMAAYYGIDVAFLTASIILLSAAFGFLTLIKLR